LLFKNAGGSLVQKIARTLLCYGRSLCGQLMALSLFSAPAVAAAVELQALVDHLDALWRSQSSHAVMTMEVITSRYQRSLTLEAWSQGRDRSLVVIRQPQKERGIATLKVGNAIWNYLPRIDRLTRVPASMMGGAWMGSHMTNDDLLQDSTFARDYQMAITFEGVRDGAAVIELTALPHPTAAVVWGRVVIELSADGWVPRRSDYYDESGTLMRTLAFDRLQEIDGRQVPMRIRLQPADKPNEATELTYQELSFDRVLEDDLFTLHGLRARR
jgi:hypothetical protein